MLQIKVCEVSIKYYVNIAMIMYDHFPLTVYT